MSKTALLNDKGEIVLVDWVEKPQYLRQTANEASNEEYHKERLNQWKEKLLSQPQTPTRPEDKAVKENGWVSVDSGNLPEHGKTVILHTDNGIIFDGFYSEPMKDFIVRGEVFNRVKSLGHYITHWYLPQPPIK